MILSGIRRYSPTIKFGLSLLILGSSQACTVLLDFSAPIQGDEPDASIVVEADAPAPVPEATRCSVYEPNENTDAAESIDLQSSTFLASICKSGNLDDIDTYGFTIGLPTMFTAQLTYANTSQTDLDLRLLDAAGEAILISIGSDSLEQIESTLTAGTYYLEVSPSAPTPDVDYELTLFVAE